MMYSVDMYVFIHIGSALQEGDQQIGTLPKTSSSHFMACFREAMAKLVLGKSSFCTQMQSFTSFPDLVLKVSLSPARLPATRANR